MTTRIDNYAQTPNGLLLLADGFSNMQVWDGVAATTQDAGLAAPATALTLAQSGSGNIVGAYFGYQRFIDARGQPSNFSPISAVLNAHGGSSGAITGASNEVPIKVTAVAHGLTTGTSVLISGVQGNASANGSWTITVVDVDTFTLDNSAGSADYTTGGGWVSGVSTITYNTVPVPVEAKAVRRQLLRNTAGQAAVFFVDVDTTDLASTSFSSTKVDSVLATGLAVPFLNPDGTLFANRNDKPPNHKQALAHHLGRMFAAVESAWNQGNLQVTNGSNQVTGVNTGWPAALVGRLLYVVGAVHTYTITAVDTANQVLTLAANYADASDLYAVYAIQPQPAERRVIYYSVSGAPESWPPTNGISLQEDGDELSGLMSMGSMLYVLEKRHVYRFTFQTEPGVDGFIFLASVRGCLNQRCWVVVEDTAYLLDQQGVFAFGSGEEAKPVSHTIQQVFQPAGAEGTDTYINWAAAAAFHASHYPSEETIRFFVCVAGDRLPRHALCYDYRGETWWYEAFACPISASATATYLGARRVFAGSDARKVLLLGQGPLDGPDPSAGQVRGLVDSVSATSLTDASATFPAAGVVGHPVCITAGPGKGQTRRVTEVSSGTLYLDRPWLVWPDATSTYQLGGIPWTWKSQWFRYAESEKQVPTRVDLAFLPVPNSATLDLRIYRNYATVPVSWRSSRTAAAAEGFAVDDGGTDFTLDLTKANGHAQQRLDRHRERNAEGDRHMAVEMGGVTNLDTIRLYWLVLDGVEP